MSKEDRTPTNRPPEPPKTWGSLARKGAFRLAEDTRDAGTAMPDDREPAEWTAEEWHDEGPVNPVAKPVKEASTTRSQSLREPVEVDVDVAVADLVSILGDVRGKRAQKRLGEAAVAYANERYGEARSLLAPLVSSAPSSVALRELFGLTLYRLGQWKPAIKELDFVRQSGGGFVQHPVILDCYRGLRKWREVDELWNELLDSSAAPAIFAEARIVYAGSLADRGDLAGAIELLRRKFRLRREPREADLRHAYVLADLYERGGDLPAARTWFRRIADVDPGFADVLNRLDQL